MPMPDLFGRSIALGLPSLAGYDLRSALDKAHELCFQSVMVFPNGPRAEHSLGAFPTLDFDTAGSEQKQRLSQWLAEFSHVSVHQAWNEEWTSWLECAACVGAELVTIHQPPQSLAGRVDQQCLDRFRVIGDEAAARRLRIGIENAGGRVDTYLDFIQRLDHPAVGATLDTGHCAFFEEVKGVKSPRDRVEQLNETLDDLVTSLNDRLFHCHAHNVRAGDWRDHRSVPDGVIDFRRLVTALRAIHYDGMLVLELEEPEMEEQLSRSGRALDSLLASP